MKWGEDDLFSLPASAIDFASVRRFILRAEEIDALTESSVLELKVARSGRNIVEAAAAFANTDGGVVLVGVADDAQGEDRLIGTSSEEIEKLRSQFRHMLPEDARPETIPVVIPGRQDRVILVVRIDADRAHHPVVVQGRVMIRAPGETVRASRDQMIALVDRGRQAHAPSSVRSPSGLPFSPQNHPLWRETEVPDFELRMSGGLQLPNRARERAWLGTAAKEALAAALNEAPAPRLIYSERLRSSEIAPWYWEIEETRSRFVKLRAERGRGVKHRWVPNLLAAAYMQISPRNLDFVIGVGIEADSDKPQTNSLSMSDLFEWLVAASITVDEACAAVAEALDLAEPTLPEALQGWLTSRQGHVTDFLQLTRFADTSTNDLPGVWFEAARPPRRAKEELAAQVRDWLTVMLLDAGVSHFERDLENLDLPNWVSNPGNGEGR